MEGERLAELARYAILDTPPDPELDAVAAVCARLLDAPAAFIGFIDAHRQWLKARHGLHIAETPREESFCRIILDAKEPLVVEDAAADPRFAGNPLVVGPLGIRFYAGAPLITP